MYSLIKAHFLRPNYYLYFEMGTVSFFEFASLSHPVCVACEACMSTENFFSDTRVSRE